MLRGALKSQRRPSNIRRSASIIRSCRAGCAKGSTSCPSPPAAARRRSACWCLRSYVLADNARHYDGVIAAIEARGLQRHSGLRDRTRRASGDREILHARIGRPIIDALVSLIGFSLVGGPAYNDAKAAEEILAKLDVPYIAAHPVEFQTLEQWRGSDRGLLPVESTIMVAIPELDGSTGPMVFGGRPQGGGTCAGCARNCVFPASESARDMQVCVERAEMLAARVEKLALSAAHRASARARSPSCSSISRRTPAHWHAPPFSRCFESLHLLLRRDEAQPAMLSSRRRRVEALRSRHHRRQRRALRRAGQRARADPDRRPCAPRERGSARSKRNGVRRLVGIRATARRSTSRRALRQCLRRRPARLRLRGRSDAAAVREGLLRRRTPSRPSIAGCARTSAPTPCCISARMARSNSCPASRPASPRRAGPTGSSAICRISISTPPTIRPRARWPSAAPARRSISYLTPPVANAGLYRGLVDLKASIDRWRGVDRPRRRERERTRRAHSGAGRRARSGAAEPAWRDDAATADRETRDSRSRTRIHADPARPACRRRAHGARGAHRHAAGDGRGAQGATLTRETIEALTHGAVAERLARDEATRETLRMLARIRRPSLAQDHELPALIHALDGRFVRPAPGGDVLRTPDVLPTGRNLHGFDPFHIPSVFAVRDGARQAARLLERHMSDGGALPETIAMVLWGTDNLKTEGGADRAGAGADRRRAALRRLRPSCRRDAAYRSKSSRRPRIDVMISLSGIFRDLLPLQIKLLARGRAFWRLPPTSRSSRISFASTRWPIIGAAWRRYGNRGAARVRQRRRRLWRKRQHADRRRPLGRRGRTRRDLYAPQGLRLWRRRPADAQQSRCCRACLRASISPIRISTPSNSASPRSIIISTRSAASAAR